MCLAILLLPVMNATAKMLTVDYPLIEVVWARFTGHFLCMTLLFWPGRGLMLFRSSRPLLQIFRSVIMFVSNGCFIVALSTVALATASAIMFTAPLIVTMLSVPLLGERVGFRRWGAVLVGFAGALIIIRPGMNTPTLDGTALGLVLVLLSAAAFALYQILTRKLSERDSAETNVIYTALVGTMVTTCIMPFVLVMPQGFGDGLLFALVGVAGGFSQYFIVKALEQAPASVVSPYLYGELILAAMIGFAVFGEFPDHWTWLGAAVISVSGLYIAYREGAIGKSRS